MNNAIATIRIIDKWEKIGTEAVRRELLLLLPEKDVDDMLSFFTGAGNTPSNSERIAFVEGYLLGAKRGETHERRLLTLLRWLETNHPEALQQLSTRQGAGIL